MIRRFPSASTARLLSAPLALLVALPVGALERLPAPENRPDAGLLAQVKSEIPTEVQGWFDAAKAAAAKGDSAEALRLQKQVVAWVQANRPPLDVFRARALNNLGTFLSGVGQKQEALAPKEEAAKIYRELAKTNPAFLGDLARSLKDRKSVV